MTKWDYCYNYYKIRYEYITSKDIVYSTVKHICDYAVSNLGNTESPFSLIDWFPG